MVTIRVRSDSGEPTKITREDGSWVDVTYDAALRIDTETYYEPGGAVLDAVDYDYDLDGNRTRKTSILGGVEDYAYSDGFKLDSVTKGGVIESFGYDGGGRVTGMERDGVFRELEYNDDDKVAKVLDDGVEVASYVFDGVGRRVEVVESGATKRYLVAPNVGDGYESPQVVTDGAGDVLEGYVFAGEHPIARFDGQGGVEYLLADAMGSVLGVADGGGALTGSVKWDAFGEVRSESGAGVASSVVGGGHGLHGMWLDEGTGLYYVRARSYDAKTGRFLSRDPVAGVIGRPESVHPYLFAKANPRLWLDPSGRFAIPLIAAFVRTFVTITAVLFAAKFVGVACIAADDDAYDFVEGLQDAASDSAVFGIFAGLSAAFTLGAGAPTILMASIASSIVATMVVDQSDPTAPVTYLAPATKTAGSHAAASAARHVSSIYAQLQDALVRAADPGITARLAEEALDKPPILSRGLIRAVKDTALAQFQGVEGKGRLAGLATTALVAFASETATHCF